MIEILKRIGSVIETVARKEDSDLRAITGEGIFYMPELAFSYACGKKIMLNRRIVFGDLDVKWTREQNLGNGGPADMIFELPNGKSIVIEYKLRATSDAYIRDIEKLSRLNPEKYIPAFCALVDAYSDGAPYDERIRKIETVKKAEVVPLLEPKPHFRTIQTWYKSEISCVLGFWAVCV